MNYFVFNHNLLGITLFHITITATTFLHTINSKIHQGKERKNSIAQ